VIGIGVVSGDGLQRLVERVGLGQGPVDAPDVLLMLGSGLFVETRSRQDGRRVLHARRLEDMLGDEVAEGAPGRLFDDPAEEAVEVSIVLVSASRRAFGGMGEQVADRDPAVALDVHAVLLRGVVEIDLALLHELQDDLGGKGLGQ